MIISLACGDIDADVKFYDGYFLHQYRNRTVEVFYFYDSLYLLEKSKKIKRRGEKMSLVYGNHYTYTSSDSTYSTINVSTKRTMDTLKTPSESFKPYVDTMSINQYVSERGKPYYIIYLLKDDSCTWQQIDVLMTFLHEAGHHLDPVAGLRDHHDKEREANRIRDELLIRYYYLAKTLLNLKVR